MEWVSNARYNQELNAGTIFDAKKTGRRVTIHKLHGFGDDWYLTCRDLGIERENLRTEEEPGCSSSVRTGEESVQGSG